VIDVFLSTIARDITERKRAEAKLAELHRQQERILSAVGEGLHGIDRDGRIIFENSAAAAMLGWGVQDLIGRPAHQVMHHTKSDGSPYPVEECHIYATLRDGASHRVENEVFWRKDGTSFPVTYTSAPMRDETGAIVGAVVAFRDITERKEAEEALRISEERFKSIFTNAPVGVYQSTVDALLFVNPAMAKMFGFSNPAEMMASKAKPESFYIRPEQRRQLLREAMASGTYVEHELEERRKDGSVFVTKTHMRVVRDDSGEIKFVEGFVEDITASKRAEESLARLATVVGQTSEAIVITDTTGTIVYINPAFEKSTGYTPAEAIGQNPRLLKSGRQDAQFYRRMWDQLARGEVWRGHFINRRKDGTFYEEASIISPVRDVTGKVTNYVGVNRDVTREVQLETELRQSQKMEAVGQLAGGVAHDFNNILSALLMQTDLLTTVEHLPEEAQAGLKEIRADVNRAADLTRQLLLFSRRQVMQSRILDLNEIVRNLAKMLQRIIGEDVQLQLRLDPVPLMTRADAGMLEQVLMNLCVNARDAMPGGGYLIIKTTGTDVDEKDARLNLEAAPGHYVSLSVSDTGKGIPPEILPKIFEPFFTTKKAGKGTGLGLATVFGIVKQHQGWIKVDNRPGEGATFRVFLPASAEPAVAETPAEAKPEPRVGTETVLVVEDEAVVRKLTRKMLERHGYKVLEASNGPEALERWEEHRGSVALLLTDLVMPGGMSGQELARQLVANHPQLKVVYTSGYSAEIAGQEFLLRPGDAYIQKPCPSAQLLEAVRRSLDG